MDAVVVDTDVISYVFKKDSRARRYRRHLVGKQGLMSFLTLAELDWWALRSGWGAARRRKLQLFLVQFAMIPFDRRLCQLWADATQEARVAGKPIQCADAWIAATALHQGVPLVTNNPADYAGIGALTVPSVASP
jgi:predicted nucleic acid-binding protein